MKDAIRFGNLAPKDGQAPLRKSGGTSSAAGGTSSAPPQTSLHKFETGAYLTDDCSGFPACRAWTGTDADGTAATQTCDDWTASTGAWSGSDGSAADGPLPLLWSQIGASSCNASFHLYCLSTVITVFWDGFELTGDTSRWSAAVP